MYFTFTFIIVLNQMVARLMFLSNRLVRSRKYAVAVAGQRFPQ